MPDPLQRVQCPNCAFENPATRRYCQDCGAPLRPGTSPAAPDGGEPHPWEAARDALGEKPPAAARQRIAGALGIVKAGVFSVLRIALLGAMAALVAVMLLPPRDAPNVAPMNDAEAAHFRDLLLSTSSGINRSHVDFSWDLTNAYLAWKLSDAPRSDGGWTRAEFVRAYLVPGDDEFTLYMERKLLGIPYTTGIAYRPVIRARGAELRATGGAVGRLRLPAALTRVYARSFESLANPLVYETGILRNLESVKITPESAALLFPARDR